jgi:hypothetical protein
MGPTAVATLVAHITFWVVLAYGWYWQEVSDRGAVLFVAFWAAGFLGLPYLPSGDALFSSYVAVLDIVLVFLVFKGDLPLG